MSIERFHEQMESAREQSSLFEALRKLRDMDDASAALEVAPKWPNWVPAFRIGEGGEAPA
ncbi:MAG: hypothetical protein AAF657_33275 [Acidobacteriota bacterium]